MTECDRTEEFIYLLTRADADTIAWIEKCLILCSESSGFNAAFKEATPPGGEYPPPDIMKALVNEWAEKEGL